MHRLLHAALVFVGVSTPVFASAGGSPVGEWTVADGSGRINIQRCGSHLCGTVSWSKEEGRIGVQILRSMKTAGDARWEGTILDPRNGKIYQSSMTFKGAGLLKVEGCVMGVLCGGETWTRSK